MVTKSFWKPLSPNTIFVTVDNPTKRREYAEQVVKVFYLSNVTAPQEMQEMLTVLRTVVDVQKVFSYTSQNALVVRAEADTMALVEKLISDLDKPRPEVIIDVMVMEVSTHVHAEYHRRVRVDRDHHERHIRAAAGDHDARHSERHVRPPDPPRRRPARQHHDDADNHHDDNRRPRGTPTSHGCSAERAGPHLERGFLDHQPARSRVRSRAERLQPRGCCRRRRFARSTTSKATLKIGEKVPTASGSFQPGVAGVGVSPLVNTQFTYLDVGVNMEITPQVHENNEVSMHIDLDISQVDNYQNLGGISEPEIGQNKETADIRLREGEVNLIGGIIQKTDTKSDDRHSRARQHPGLGLAVQRREYREGPERTGDRADSAHRARAGYHGIESQGRGGRQRDSDQGRRTRPSKAAAAKRRAQPPGAPVAPCLSPHRSGAAGAAGDRAAHRLLRRPPPPLAAAGNARRRRSAAGTGPHQFPAADASRRSSTRP